jgi:FkbM family methyltransferase
MQVSSIWRKSVVFYRRTRKFTEGLGVWAGIFTLLSSICGIEEISVATPNVRYPVVLRPRTSDRFVFEEIFLDCDYDLSFDISPRLIVDAGANVGFASIFFANRYPGSTIIALEPEPENFRLLLQNTRLYPEIVPVQAALWGRTAILAVSRDTESWAHKVSEPSLNDHTTVPGLTIADLLRNYGRASIDILKMDIEGAEIEVFNNEAHHWLKTTKVLIVELHDRLRPGCSAAFDNAIRGLSFRRMEQGENIILSQIDI